MSLQPVTCDLASDIGIPCVPIGNRIRGALVLQVPPAAVGIVGVQTGPNDPIPLTYVGQVLPLATTSGIRLQATSGATLPVFPLGSLVTLLVQFDP